MIKKLTRLGNSSALVLDRTIMQLMEIDSDTPLKLTVDGRRLVVQPLSDEERRKLVDESIEHTGRKHAELFRRLAK